MGIKGLNQYFKKHASPKSIHSIDFHYLERKTVVVDISIYLYKFLENGKLLENMYEFITQFLQYKINPIFIFDGKPPESKIKVLNARQNKRQTACNKYYDMKEQYETNHFHDEKEKNDIYKKMSIYKKRSIRVSNKNIDRVKSMMTAMCVEFYEAPNEADGLCAEYVKSGKAWACISDDMDLFVFDCTRVIREWDIRRKQAIIYHFEKLKQDIGIRQTCDIKHIFPLAGNDYCSISIPIESVMKWYKMYINIMDKPITIYFLDWLTQEGYISQTQYNNMIEYTESFNVNETIEETIFEHRKKINYDTLCSLLVPYGFIFIA